MGDQDRTPRRRHTPVDNGTARRLFPTGLVADRFWPPALHCPDCDRDWFPDVAGFVEFFAHHHGD